MEISLGNLIRIMITSSLVGMMAAMLLRNLAKWIWRIILLGGLLLLLSKLFPH